MLQTSCYKSSIIKKLNKKNNKENMPAVYSSSKPGLFLLYIYTCGTHFQSKATHIVFKAFLAIKPTILASLPITDGNS